MKKYLLGFLAFAIFFSMSAFAFKEYKKADIEYYFYEVINGQVNTSSPLNPGDPMTLGEFEESELLVCPAGDNEDCVRAWEVGHTPTQSGPGDETIKKSN